MEFSEPKDVRYPWQIPLGPIARGRGRTATEARREHAESLFRFEEEMRRQLPGTTYLVFDEAEGFYRFKRGPKKGRFALSREYADWEGLKELGYFEGWGL